jgi:hypothetical protein
MEAVWEALSKEPKFPYIHDISSYRRDLMNDFAILDAPERAQAYAHSTAISRLRQIQDGTFLRGSFLSFTKSAGSMAQRDNRHSQGVLDCSTPICGHMGRCPVQQRPRWDQTK